MEIEEVDVNQVKQNLLRIPKAKLVEINNFIEFILSKAETGRLKRVERLEGIWKGLGFDRISDLDNSIREIRDESEKAMSDRLAKCIS
jgi:hypothetical protein